MGRKEREKKLRQINDFAEGYPIVGQYKYLGVIFDESMKFDMHLNSIIGRMEKGLKIIKLLLWKGLDMWQVLYSWMTYTVPIFRYDQFTGTER